MRAAVPPGPKRPPVFQLLSYVTDPFEHFDRLKARFGDVFRVRLPGVGEQFIVGSPEGIKALTTGSYETFEREASSLRFLLGGNALIFLDGLGHRQLRNIMTPPFQGDRMRGYGPAMLRVTEEALAARAKDSAGPIQPDMQEITLRVILHCVFGLDSGPRFERMKQLMVEFLDHMFDPRTFVASLLLSGERVLSLLEALGTRQRNAVPDHAPALSRLPIKRTADLLGAIDAMLFEEIERGRRAGEGREDILSLLVQVRDEHGQLLSREQLRDQLFMLLLAGHESTSNSLCWALYQLSHRPDVLAEIRREHAQVFPNGFDPLRARELPYLGAVIQETMRLMPIAVGVARKLKHDMQIDGYTLPKGSVAIPCAYLTQRDPRVWERPLHFDPARFLQKKIGMASHFPFGAGVWRCLGAAFADYEMRVVLAALLERYDLEVPADERAQPLLKGVTIAPASGLRIRLKARAEARIQGPYETMA